MSISVQYITPNVAFIGDGVATSATLSMLEWPFQNISRITSIVLSSPSAAISGISLSGTILTINFNTAGSGEFAQTQFEVHYTANAG